MYVNNWFIILLVQHIITKLGYSLSYYPSLLFSILGLVIVGTIELFIIKLYENKKDSIKRLFIKE